MIPSMIFYGKPSTDFKQDRIVFGSYAPVYTGKSNDIKRRSIQSIGNYFMSL